MYTINYINYFYSFKVFTHYGMCFICKAVKINSKYS